MLMIKSLMLCSVLALSACGVVYTNPTVKGTPEQVKVVELTSHSVAYANLVKPYSPREVPSVFNRVSGIGKTNSGEYIPTPASRNYQRPPVSLPPRIATGPYRLGISDVVLLATPTPQSAEALTGLIAAQNKRQGYTIQDDGAIAVPDIGRIDIVGQTMEEAEATVFQALVENQIDPKFSLEIAEFNSKSVSIGGAVRSAQITPITLKPLTLQNALQTAGGIDTITPEYTTIRIYRGGKQYQIPFQELSTQPKLQDLVLHDGDSIFIENDFQKQVALIGAKTQAFNEIEMKTDQQRAQSEEARSNFMTKLELGSIKRDYAYLTGEVAKQGRFALPFDNTASLADILYSEGGIRTQFGDPGQIYVLRTTGVGQPITAYHLDAGNAINLTLTAKMKLRPDDVVFVTEQKVTSWSRVINQILPTFSFARAALLN